MLVRFNFNLTQAKIASEENYNEGLHRSGWPACLQGMDGLDCLHLYGDAKTCKWVAPIPSFGVLDYIGVEKPS